MMHSMMGNDGQVIILYEEREISKYTKFSPIVETIYAKALKAKKQWLKFKVATENRNRMRLIGRTKSDLDKLICTGVIIKNFHVDLVGNQK